MNKKHFLALDSWRGICALLVAIHHMVWFSINDYHNRIIESFYLFVDFFFVLSGFVIAYNYYFSIKNSSDFIIYFIRRIGRVWPAHAAFMFLFLMYFVFLYLIHEDPPYTIGASPTTYDLKKFPLVLLLTNSLGIYSGGWNLPSWSISAEIFSYAAFGLVFLKKTRFIYSIILIFIGLFGVLFFGDGQINMTANFGFLRCLWGFGIGILTFLLWDRIECKLSGISKIYASMCEIISFIIVILFLWFSVDSDGSANTLSIAAPLVFGLSVIVFSNDRGIISKALSVGIMQHLGKLSYSIYISHWLVMLILASLYKKFLSTPYIEKHMWGGKYLFWDLSNSTHFWVSLICFILLTIIISSASYKIVEDPCRRLSGKIASSFRKNILPTDH